MRKQDSAHNRNIFEFTQEFRGKTNADNRAFLRAD